MMRPVYLDTPRTQRGLIGPVDLTGITRRADTATNGKPLTPKQMNPDHFHRRILGVGNLSMVARAKRAATV